MLDTRKVDNYGKYKIPQEVTINDFLIANRKVVAVCSDKSIKVWDADNYNILKGVTLSEYGAFISIALSKNDEFLICGTSEGYVLGFDAKRLGQ